MGIISSIQNLFKSNKGDLSANNPQLKKLIHQFPDCKTVGETGAVCPNCKIELEKKTSRKKKCPHCKKYIYSRTRPYDKKKILVTEVQIEIIEEQWAIINGQHDLFLKEKRRMEKIAEKLRNRSGKEPSQEVVEWLALNEQSVEIASTGNWGFYRNKRLEMAKHLEKRKMPQKALQMYFEVCYLDSNGPNNTGGWPDQMKRTRPPFSQDSAFIAPGLVRIIKKLIEKLDLDLKNAESLYIQRAKETQENLAGIGLPISPELAWEELKDEIEWSSTEE
jgi:ssDNA-binding Zn-finger/Zn-ribbon topoisomerase 1